MLADPVEMAAAVLGAISAGVTTVPLNPAAAPVELTAEIANLALAAAVTDEVDGERMAALAGGGGACGAASQDGSGRRPRPGWSASSARWRGRPGVRDFRHHRRSQDHAPHRGSVAIHCSRCGGSPRIEGRRLWLVAVTAVPHQRVGFRRCVDPGGRRSHGPGSAVLGPVVLEAGCRPVHPLIRSPEPRPSLAHGKGE
jgi:hypothetical protein